jgi:Cu(I)/Ag(I) efflux system periplasmic protein CusF
MQNLVINIKGDFRIMKTIFTALSATLLLAASNTVFAATPAASTDKPVMVDNVKKKPMAEGEIKKIDKESGKVTIKHGEIKNLDMPPMTMVFRVKDSAVLEKVKVGDKINFSAEKVNGNYTVTEVEAAK